LKGNRSRPLNGVMRRIGIPVSSLIVFFLMFSQNEEVVKQLHPTENAISIH